MIHIFGDSHAMFNFTNIKYNVKNNYISSIKENLNNYNNIKIIICCISPTMNHKINQYVL
jgi:hypothetical protein